MIDRVRVAGRAAAIDLFEVLCEAGSAPPQRATDAEYGAAWALYGEQKFGEAADAFAALAKRYPEDGAVALLPRARGRLLAHQRGRLRWRVQHRREVALLHAPARFIASYAR